MKKETINATYLSPAMKVVTVEIRQVMCQSPGTMSYTVDGELTIND